MTKLKSRALEHQAFLMAKEALKAKGTLDVAIVGTSMLPLIPASGYVAKVFPLQDFSHLQRFDVLVFWQSGILISHYFWKRNSYFNDDQDDPYLVTKPLNPLRGVDHPIKFENILGIVPAVQVPWWLKAKVYASLWFK